MDCRVFWNIQLPYIRSGSSELLIYRAWYRHQGCLRVDTFVCQFRMHHGSWTTCFWSFRGQVGNWFQCISHTIPYHTTTLHAKVHLYRRNFKFTYPKVHAHFIVKLGSTFCRLTITQDTWTFLRWSSFRRHHFACITITVERCYAMTTVWSTWLTAIALFAFSMGVARIIHTRVNIARCCVWRRSLVSRQ